MPPAQKMDWLGVSWFYPDGSYKEDVRSSVASDNKDKCDATHYKGISLFAIYFHTVRC